MIDSRRSVPVRHERNLHSGNLAEGTILQFLDSRASTTDEQGADCTIRQNGLCVRASTHNQNGTGGMAHDELGNTPQEKFLETPFPMGPHND